MDKKLFLEWIERARQNIKENRMTRKYIRLGKAWNALLDKIEEDINNKKYDKNKIEEYEKDDINKKVDTIVDFANYQAKKLELDIVNLVRSNLDNLNNVRYELEKKITELDFIDIYIGEDEVYEWVENYHLEDF